MTAMFRLILFAAAFYVVAGFPHFRDAEIPKIDIKEYFGVPLNEIKWHYVNSETELNNAFKGGQINNSFIVVDINIDVEKCKLIISDQLTYDSFGEISLSNKNGSKVGWKINVLSMEAFKLYGNDTGACSSTTETPPTVPTRLVPSPTSAYQNPIPNSYLEFPDFSRFPILLHLNTPLISIDDVANYIKKNPNYADHSYSLGWSDNGCINGDIKKIIEDSRKLDNLKLFKTVVLKSMPNDISALKKEFDAVTFQISESNLRCSDPKTIYQNIDKDTFIDATQSARSHIELCRNNKLISESFQDVVGKIGEKQDLAALEWVKISEFGELEKEIKEHMVKVDVAKGENGVSILGESFKTFFEAFRSKQPEKGLQLIFEDTKAYEAFWEIELSNKTKLDTLRTIQIYINTDKVKDLKYADNKWLDCYSIAVGLDETPDSYQFRRFLEKIRPLDEPQIIPYNDQQITNLFKTTKLLNTKEISYALNLNRVLNSKIEIIEKIFEDKEKAITLSLKEKETIDETKNDILKELLSDNIGNTVIDVDTDVREDIFKPVTMEDLNSEITSDFTKLPFTANIHSFDELDEVLKDQKQMIQVNVIEDSGEVIIQPATPSSKSKFTLVDCLNNMKSKKNGIKLHFKTSKAFKDAFSIPEIKYANFPIWIHLDVLGDGAIDLRDFEKEDLAKIKHHFVLGWRGEDFNARNMKEQRKLLSSAKKVTYAIRADHVYKSNSQFLELYNSDDHVMIWLTESDNVISKELRTKLPKDTMLYLNIPNRVILQECAKNRYLKINGDLSKLQITTFIETNGQLKNLLGEKSARLIRAKVKINDKNEWYIHESFPLDEFLDTFDQNAENHGIIFTFDSMDTFNKATHNERMKTFNWPIWFDIQVSDDEPVDYAKYNDVIDCRTLLLGWKRISDDKYTDKDVAFMKNLKSGDEPRIYAIRAEYAENSWFNLEKLVANSQNKFLLFTPEQEDERGVIISKKLRSFVSKYMNLMFVDIYDNNEILLECPDNQDALEYFEVEDDLSKLKIGDLESFSATVPDDVDMIRAKVKPCDTQLCVSDSWKLSEFLATFEDEVAYKSKGLIFSFDDTDHFDEAMNHKRYGKLKTMDRPIWFEADVVSTDKLTTNLVKLDYNRHNDFMDCRTLLLGWKLDKKFDRYTKDHVKKMLDMPFGEERKIYSVQSDYAEISWNELLPLFNYKNSKVLATLQEDPKNFVSKTFRKLLHENKQKLFVDFPETKKGLLQDCPVNQNVFKYFTGIKNLAQDLSKLKISDPISGHDDLTATLIDGPDMIRAHIKKCGSDWCVGDNSLGVREFFDVFTQSLVGRKRGIILSFTDSSVAKDVIRSNYENIRNLNCPIWLDFNVLKARSATDAVIPVDYKADNDLIDCRTLLLGWEETDVDFRIYTYDDVSNMEELETGDEMRIYSVRAEFTEDSWEELERLLVNGDKFLFRLPEEISEEIGFHSKNFRTFLDDKRTEAFVNFPGSYKLYTNECPLNQDALMYFNDIKESGDLSQLKISSYVNTAKELKTFLADDDIHMIRALVVPCSDTLCVNDVNFKLSDFFKTFTNNLRRAQKGIIFTFESTEDLNAAINPKSELRQSVRDIVIADHDNNVTLENENSNYSIWTEEVERALNLKKADSAFIYESMRTLNHPIWLEFAAVSDSDNEIRPDYKITNDMIDCRTLLLGWDTEIENIYSSTDITNMKTFDGGDGMQIYAVRAEYTEKSWGLLQMLFNDNNNKLLVFMPEHSEEFFVSKQFRTFANDNKMRIFLDFPGAKQALLNNCPLNQDVFEYFDGLKDLSSLVFSENIATIYDFNVALSNNEEMVKVRVSLNQNDEPIIGETVKLVDLLYVIDSPDVKSGLKLHFQSTESFAAALRNPIVLSKLRNMQRPVWIDADVVGSGENVKLNYNITNDLLDCRTLSLGWSGETSKKYTEPNVNAMKMLKYELGTSKKSYTVELSQLVNNWKHLETLLTASKDTTMTLVSESEDLYSFDFQLLSNIIGTYRGRFALDMPSVLQKQLYNGCGSISGVSVGILVLLQIVMYLF